MSFIVSIAATLVVVGASISYVRQVRHPKLKPLEAYAIFAVAFSASASLLFSPVVWAVEALDVSAFGASVAALSAAALILLPAMALATWLVRQSPWSTPSLG